MSDTYEPDSKVASASHASQHVGLATPSGTFEAVPGVQAFNGAHYQLTAQGKTQRKEQLVDEARSSGVTASNKVSYQAVLSRRGVAHSAGVMPGAPSDAGSCHSQLREDVVPSALFANKSSPMDAEVWHSPSAKQSAGTLPGAAPTPISPPRLQPNHDSLNGSGWSIMDACGDVVAKIGEGDESEARDNSPAPLVRGMRHAGIDGSHHLQPSDGSTVSTSRGSLTPTSRSASPGPRYAASGSVGSIRGSTSSPISLRRTKQPWVPAVAYPNVTRTFDPPSTPTPPRSRSGASTPRRRRREQLFSDLYSDAVERNMRWSSSRRCADQLEIEHMIELQKTAKDERRSRRRYHSSDTRTFEQKNEEMLFRQAELQQYGLREKKLKEERELQECTFAPKIARRPSKSRGEREAERQLRQLSVKQSGLRVQLVQLEREARQSHDQRQQLYRKRYQEVQHEEAQKVIDFLKDGEGLEYLKARAEKIVESGSVTRVTAQQHIVSELVQDAQDLILRKVREELEGPHLRAEADLQKKSLQIVRMLEGIETTAVPLLNSLSGTEAVAVLEASGFTLNLASEVKRGIKLDSPEQDASSMQQSHSPRVGSPPYASPDAANQSVVAPGVLLGRSQSQQLRERPVSASSTAGSPRSSAAPAPLVATIATARDLQAVHQHVLHSHQHLPPQQLPQQQLFQPQRQPQLAPQYLSSLQLFQQGAAALSDRSYDRGKVLPGRVAHPPPCG